MPPSPSPFTITEQPSTANISASTHAQQAKYTPIDNPEPQPGDVTVVGAPGTAIPKELYEPLWEELHARSAPDGFRIRAIWVADSFNQGGSGVLNEGYLGSDPSWFDHSRDLLQLIQTFRHEMPRPIMGVGHSAGAVAQVFLSLIHPRLLTSLILIEPFLYPSSRPPEESRWIMTRAKQKDIFASREEAARKSKKLMGTWDPRVRERYMQHAFRDLPTPLYPDNQNQHQSSEGKEEKAKPIALTTPISQEVLSYARPNLHRHKELGVPYTQNDNSRYGPSPPHDALAVPDMISGLWKNSVFYRPEGIIGYRLLPHVRPGVLYVSGEGSALSKAGLQKKAATRTGTGVGGSGGVEYGRVKHVVVTGAGHFVPMEKVRETAEAVGGWIGVEVQRWKGEERRIEEGWKGLSARERVGLSEEWRAMMDVAEKTFARREKPKSKL
ncbi:uncharacterized protein DSM5745_05542 [Aspergillus mulundensis]|uniref:AB hydrolase-1 domain-containing protein n=1 Tax=Aspergillus mulundensis TaxID=1810919 RepID=A0A3D8RXV4_9EURO|nr:hypothetical protein DSM5745_05542 [Aspergillus mulundensis]RDW78690.1 hypothetical protein DSM5745_05542 [Aspergillus mulundensis]